MTVRLPEALASEIEAEAHERNVSKSDVVRERLAAGGEGARLGSTPLDTIADLIGAVDGLPVDLSARKKEHLRELLHGRIDRR